MKQTQSPSQLQNQKPEDFPETVELTKSFSCPVERLWAAMYKPELIVQWWGPENYTSLKAEIDFREGGRFFFGMTSPQGETNWSVGTVDKIVPNRQIVLSETFANEKGKEISPKQAGIPNWPGEYNGVITFDIEKRAANQTTLMIHHDGIPPHQRNDCVGGWDSSLEKLRTVVEGH